MDHCCGHKRQELEALALHSAQRRVLVAVLIINLTMFFIEFGAGIVAHSSALQADAVDMLGDAIVYGLSLWAVNRGGALGGRCGPRQGAADPGLLCLHRGGGAQQADPRRASFQRLDAGVWSHRAGGQSGVPGIVVAVPRAQHQHEKHLRVFPQ